MSFICIPLPHYTLLPLLFSVPSSLPTQRFLRFSAALFTHLSPLSAFFSFPFTPLLCSPLVKKSLQAGFSSTYNAELVLLSGTKCHPGGHFSLCYIRICNPKLATSPIIELLLCRADNYQNFQSHTSETKRDALGAFVTLIYVRKADKEYSSATTFLAPGIGSCPLWWAIKYVYYGNNTLYLNEGTCSPVRTVVLYKKKTSITQNCSLDLE